MSSSAASRLQGRAVWRPGYGRVALTLAALALVGAPPAAAQILDAAWDGREEAATFFQASLEKERRPADWAGAITELEKCVELSPEPSWEASLQDGSGRWRRHYLPYYYLGRAWWGEGDCGQAVEWLTLALAKGEICRCTQGELRDIEKLLTKCEQRGVESGAPARELVRSECSKVRQARPRLDAVVAAERIAAFLTRGAGGGGRIWAGSR